MTLINNLYQEEKDREYKRLFETDDAVPQCLDVIVLGFFLVFFWFFPHILLVIEQNMKRQRQTYTHSFTHTLFQNVQSLENHALVIIILKIFPFLVMHTC